MGNSNQLTTEQIETTIKAYITETFMYDREGVSLTNDFPLFDQGIIDSMGIFRLISYLEEQFSVTVEPEEVIIENFATVNAITSLVAGSTNKG
jgi:acyl carrier protein